MTDIADYPNPAALFYMLFEGHPDAYGTEEGGCVREDAYEAVQQHCFRGIPCGIYPMTPEGTVRWGCSDFDTKDALVEARKVQRVLQKMRVESFLEVSRSKGYHLWVFCEEFVPAAIMRRALLFAHHVADVPAREVNPKQEQPGPKGLSSYVRIPYVHQQPDANGRRVMVDENGENIPFMDFLKAAYNGMTNRFLLQRWADKYKPPVQNSGPDTPPAKLSPTIIQQLNSYARRLIEEGVADWRLEPGKGGRSGAMLELAKQVAKTHPRPVAKAILYSVDDQWGKYADRDPSSRNVIIEDILNRAYR